MVKPWKDSPIKPESKALRSAQLEQTKQLKSYVDAEIDTDIDTHEAAADPHTGYILATGTRAFTGTVSGITPTSAAHLARKDYVDARETDILTKVIVGDGTAARELRAGTILIEDGTNASTIKCTFSSRWNGDADGPTDNVAKGATTGNYTLNAAGDELTVEAAALSGNVVMAFGRWAYNATTAYYVEDIRAESNDIYITLRNTSGTQQDLTTLVDTGSMRFDILYITDA